MYQQYFELNEQPFSIAVNPRYLFMSDRHRDALAHLLYGIGSGGGFILLTGEVGTGKTTLNRCLLEQLPDQTDIAIVLNPALSAVELLATVCDEFEVDYEQGTDSLKLLTDALHQFLLANHRANRRTVLMIDEAQHLGFEVLEQIRLLTNLETDEKKLLQIILTGQPELAAMLRRPELRQLNQRITARFNLTPLSTGETSAYIQHRLQIAGLPSDRVVFPNAASKAVYRLSGGIPRLINLLCDRAMMGAYGRQAEVVSARLVTEAAAEVMGETSKTPPDPVRASRSYARLLVVALTLLCVAVLFAARPNFSLPFTVETSLAERQGVGSAAINSPDMRTVSPDSQMPAAAGGAADAVDERPWLLSPAQAERALWGLLQGQPLVGGLCDAASAAGWWCERYQADVWDAVLDHNRPSILELRRDNGFAGAAVLLGISKETAQLWTGATVCEVPVAALAALWLGRFSYLWQTPTGWTGPVSKGATGIVVADIVRALSVLDGLPVPPLSVYTAAVEERVRAFQRFRGLEVDGVMGARSWRALSDEIGEGFSLDIALSSALSDTGGASCP